MTKWYETICTKCGSTGLQLREWDDETNQWELVCLNCGKRIPLKKVIKERICKR